MVDRERMGVPLDLTAPGEPDPEAPYGYDVRRPRQRRLLVGAGRPDRRGRSYDITIDAINAHDLWDTPTFEPFKPLRDAVGDDRDAARALLQSLAPTLSFALLERGEHGAPTATATPCCRRSTTSGPAPTATSTTCGRPP